MRIILLFLFLLPSVSYAEKAAILVIRKSRAPIYKKSTFDSKIMAYAPKGKKLYGTKNARPGIQGFGLFHKVRIKKGVYGYVLDTDVVGFNKNLKKKSKLKSGKNNSKKLSRRERKKINQRNRESGAPKASNMQKWKGYPLSFVKAAGGGVGMINYTIDFGGKELSGSETSFALKLSGPGWLFKTMPIDLTVAAHFGGVAGLDQVSQGASSGYFILADISLPFRLKHSKNWSIYAGLGLLVKHADFSFMLNNDDKNVADTNIGAVGTLGFAYNMGNYLLKIEPKFYWDNTQFFGVLGTVQYVL